MRAIAALAASFLLAGCSLVSGAGPEDRIDVLFIGNSHTFNNNVPAMFERMASAGGHPVNADMVAHGGWTLRDHAQSLDTVGRIRDGQWDYVVLQEQSDVPAVDTYRELDMYPAVRGLHNEIAVSGAVTVLFMTWGHRDGSLGGELRSYSAEQAAVERAYVEIGDELGVAIAPIGVAWWTAMQNAPDLVLWVGDGNHATREGSYLATSVLYYAILGDRPVGNSYTAGIADDWAEFYQKIATEAVEANRARWNLP